MVDQGLSFVNCPSCGSLIPSTAIRCRMCGFDMSQSRDVASDSNSAPSLQSRVKNRTISLNKDEVDGLKASVLEDTSVKAYGHQQEVASVRVMETPKKQASTMERSSDIVSNTEDDRGFRFRGKEREHAGAEAQSTPREIGEVSRQVSSDRTDPPVRNADSLAATVGVENEIRSHGHQESYRNDREDNRGNNRDSHKNRDILPIRTEEDKESRSSGIGDLPRAEERRDARLDTSRSDIRSEPRRDERHQEDSLNKGRNQDRNFGHRNDRYQGGERVSGKDRPERTGERVSTVSTPSESQGGNHVSVSQHSNSRQQPMVAVQGGESVGSSNSSKDMNFKQAKTTEQGSQKQGNAKVQNQNLVNEKIGAIMRGGIDSKAGKLSGWFLHYSKEHEKAAESIEVYSGRFMICGTKLLNTDLVIGNASVSTPHAIINFLEGDLLLLDLMSEKGTFIRKFGQRDFVQLTGQTRLDHGDWVRFGDFEVLVCLVPKFDYIEDIESM